MNPSTYHKCWIFWRRRRPEILWWDHTKFAYSLKVITGVIHRATPGARNILVISTMLLQNHVRDLGVVWSQRCRFTRLAMQSWLMTLSCFHSRCSMRPACDERPAMIAWSVKDVGLVGRRCLDILLSVGIVITGTGWIVSTVGQLTDNDHGSVVIQNIATNHPTNRMIALVCY